MTKPGADHPWRKQLKTETYKWCKEQSEIRNVSTIRVARAETLLNRIPKRHD